MSQKVVATPGRGSQHYNNQDDSPPPKPGAGSPFARAGSFSLAHCGPVAGTGRSRRECSNALPPNLYLQLQRDSETLEDLFPNEIRQTHHIREGGSSGVHDEIAVYLRYFCAATDGTLQSRILDQLAGGAAGRVFPDAAGAPNPGRLSGLAGAPGANGRSLKA